jgi:hypothetical protein
MFSGPQDCLDDLDEPAPWQARKSATPSSRFFAFLNLEDPFDVRHQIANCLALIGAAGDNILMVKPGEVIHGDHHILSMISPPGSIMGPPSSRSLKTFGNI